MRSAGKCIAGQASICPRQRTARRPDPFPYHVHAGKRTRSTRARIPSLESAGCPYRGGALGRHHQITPFLLGWHALPTGDLEGIRAHLDHLTWLGVDALWISPFYPSPQEDFGYDVSDYCDVDPTYGDLAAFDRLLADAHERACACWWT